jgi:DmsE family decaheme c-type cytochrome
MVFMSRRGLLHSLLGLLVYGLSAAAMAAPPSTENFVGMSTCVSCHEEKPGQLMHTTHGETADARTPMAQQACESCHGPGQIHAESSGKELGGMIAFGAKSGVAEQTQNGQCLSCHQDTNRMHWQGSVHETEDLACSSCHSVHQPDAIMAKATEAEVCSSCHWQVRADIHKASAHPIRSGQVTCTDCHDAHGGTGPSELKAFTVDQACFSCHAEKRGPFLWEHEPVTDGCTNCHTPHGSNNPALLVRRPPHLCKQCHQLIGTGLGRPHVNEVSDITLGQGNNHERLTLGASCLNCHSQVHGSNHPAGAALQR